MDIESLVLFKAIEWLRKVLTAVIFIPLFLIVLLIGYFIPQEE